MKKQTVKSLVIAGSLFALLATSKFTIDRVTSNYNIRIISYGTEQQSEIHFVAHRGYSSMYPDNTVESLGACNELQCIEGIECDVRLTKDNELVLMHNDYIGFNRVEDFTYEELRNTDLKDYLIARSGLFKGYNFKEQEVLAKRFETLDKGSYTLCTLEDLLRTRDKSKLLFIDIKFSGYNDELLMTKIGELIRGEENVIVQSFNVGMLKRMLELYPEYSYQLLIDSRIELKSIDYMFDAYGIKYTILGEDTVEDLIEHDKLVSLWTVDSYRDFKELVDEYGEYNDDIYYITDNPDMLSYQYAKELKRVR